MKRALGACALVLLGVASSAAALACAAPRDLDLELALIAGDARRLADPAISLQRKEALSERIRSSLGTLPITLRYAVQESGRAEPELAAATPALGALLSAGKLARFSALAARLAAEHPLDLSYFRPLAITARRLEAGRAIYERQCSGCHAHPDPQAALPAPDMFAMARTEPSAEFLVRLLGGIHGDRLTSLENPFPDEAIASLAAYFMAGATPLARPDRRAK